MYIPWSPGSARIPFRVGAYQFYDHQQLLLFGYGEYVGDEVPHSVSHGLSPELRIGGVAVPLIYLDGGQHIFDCECYWDKEEVVRRLARKRDVIVLDIDHIRQQHGQEQYWMMA